MAQKEVYRLDIKVGVSGDTESKNKLTAVEKMTQQMEKRTKALDKLTSSPSIKIKDNASNALSKMKSKASELNRTKINPAVRITDNASNRISKIASNLKRLESTNVAVTLKINDQTSTYKDKVKAKSDRLKSTNINPTAKIQDQASDKIDKVKSKSDQLKDKKIRIQAVDEASKTVDKIEGKISGWIKTAAKKVISIGIAGTVALGGLGIGSAVKTFASFEQGLSNVKAVTGATNSQIKQLSDTAKSLGASTVWSASAVTEAEQLLGQAGYSVNETITALPGLLSLASAGSLDLSSATSIASSTLRGFNLDVSKTTHVADALALTANATNSDVTDLGESLKYISPVANALGISMEDAVAATGLLSNQAIVGSQAGTVLRQTMARLASPTKEASKIMKQYGINAFDAQGNMKPLSGVVNNLNSSLGKLTSQKRADVISTIFGTESMSGVMALMNQGGQSLSDLSSKLEGAKGAANKMAETKMDNLLGQWEQLKGAADTMQINLGEKLAPYAKQFVNWLTDKMPEIESKILSIFDYVSKHTNEIKSLAETVIGLGVAFTALSAAGKIGNTMKGISSLAGFFKGAGIAAETSAIAGGLSNIGALGGLLPAIFSPAGLAVAASVALIGTAVVTQNDLMNKSITTTTEQLGPLERIMNELNGHINKSKKEMVEAGFIYDDFGDGVSDSFKKGAQDASKSLLKIEMDLKRLTSNGGMDKSGINTLKNYVNDYTYEGINAMKEQQSKIQTEFQKTFSLDGVTSDTEQKVMDSLNTYFETGINKELEIRDGIYEFASDKIKENGKLMDEDIDEIKKRIAKGKALELEYTKAQNAYDQAYAKNKFSNDASKVTGIDGASELLQERAKEHQSSLDTIDNNYKGTVAYYDDLLSNSDLTDEEKENFTKGRDGAENTRNQAIQKENEGYKSDREVVYSNYEGARRMLNEKTGVQFSDKDIVAHKGTDYLKNHFKNLDQITQEGWYRIKNTSSGEMEDIYATIDKDTGEISGAWSKTANWSGGYTDELKQKVKELGQAHETERGGIQNSLSALTGSRLDANNQVISSTGSVIDQLQGVQGATGEAITGILNINGTPMQITSNASGQITTMQEFKGSMDSIEPSKDVHITTNAVEVTDQTSGLLSKLEYITSHPWTAFVNFIKGGSSSSDYTHTEQDTYDENRTRLGGNGIPVKENYVGTDNATAGINSVAERGMELVVGRRFYNFKGGEKVLNNKQTVDLLKSSNQQNNEPFQIKQGQYQLSQPQQVQVAGASGNTVQVDVQVNGGNPDTEGLIVEVTQEVGKKLREAFTNIKK